MAHHVELRQKYVVNPSNVEQSMAFNTVKTKLNHLSVIVTCNNHFLRRLLRNRYFLAFIRRKRTSEIHN